MGAVGDASASATSGVTQKNGGGEGHIRRSQGTTREKDFRRRMMPSVGQHSSSACVHKFHV